jgi:hypothetical protein
VKVPALPLAWKHCEESSVTKQHPEEEVSVKVSLAVHSHYESFVRIEAMWMILPVDNTFGLA